MKFMTVVRSYGAKTAAGATALLASFQASAAGELATAAVTEMGGVKDDATSVLSISIGVAALLAVGGIIIYAIKKH